VTNLPGFWKRLLATATLLLFACSLARAHEDRPASPPEPAKRVRPEFAPVEDDLQLPRVLLIGDSISMGYTLPVRKLLEGKANVHRPAANCGPTTRGVAQIDKWLGDGKWDVIHFNFGLHDMAYYNDVGKRVEPGEGGHPQVSLEDYEANLRRLVARMRETGATLIWCTTTPVPEGAKARRMKDVELYNQVANRVMRTMLGEERIVDNLYGLALPHLDELQRKANVHFTDAGYQKLAEQVAKTIEEHLPKKLEKDAQHTKMATGVVYHDVNRNGELDESDQPMANMRVSNGRDIVETDSSGRYELAVDDDTILFVIKPRGWRTPIRDDMLPMFYYVHKPKGSPRSEYAGVAPTGPLPESVDFPLYPQNEPNRFKAIMFGDPQPRDQKEIDYIAHDVVEELIGTDAAFGVTLGDITFNNLNLFEPQARAIAVLGIPWYNVIGNHDLNFDSQTDKQSDETFERVFGPPYYSFDYGPVHFIVLDDVEWLVDDHGQGTYQGGLGPEQVAFVKRDLQLIPKDQLVVLMMHIPLNEVRDQQRLYRLIEQRPFCMSISAHKHYHEHLFITRKDGWRGPKPHHHVVNVTVCGSWWAGMPDERGIPHTLMADGAPNGYSIMTFDGHEYQLDFKAAGRPKNYQMNIYAPEVMRADAKADVLVNVFNGSEQSTIEMKIGSDQPWSAMEQVITIDPQVARLYQEETEIQEALAAAGSKSGEQWRPTGKPKATSHMWRAALPAELAEGTHCIEVRATDMHGRKHVGYRMLRVENNASRKRDR